MSQKSAKHDVQKLGKAPPLLKEVQVRIRLKRYELGTERCYLHCIVDYIHPFQDSATPAFQR
jgi:hypothetical protein